MFEQLNRSRFTEFFRQRNGLEQSFRQWLFYPGMLFGAMGKWWDRDSARALPHEGLDFGFYEDSEGCDVWLNQDTLIPVMYEGVIVKIFDDFLGKSIIVEHRAASRVTDVLTVYGHTLPLDGLGIGSKVGEGEVIATLAKVRPRKPHVPSHLHVTLVSNRGVSVEQLDWDMISAGRLSIADPINLLDGPYHLVTPSHP